MWVAPNNLGTGHYLQGEGHYKMVACQVLPLQKGGPKMLLGCFNREAMLKGGGGSKTSNPILTEGREEFQIRIL